MTKDSVKELDLSYLSPDVLSAAKNFADLKYQIDLTGRRNPAEIPNDLHGRQRYGEYDGPYGGPAGKSVGISHFANKTLIHLAFLTKAG